MSTNDGHMHIDPTLDNTRAISPGEDRSIWAQGLRAECDVCKGAKQDFKPEPAKQGSRMQTTKQPIA